MATPKQPQAPALLPPLRIPFDYVVNAIVPANSGQAGGPAPFLVSLQIQQDADFETVFLAGTRTSPLADVQMSDGATGRNFSNAPVNVDNFFGTAQLPFPLVEPYVFARSTSVNFSFRESSGAPNTIQLVLKGYKLFPQQNPAQGSSGLIASGQ
jgi:hypothetical protein